MGSRVGEYQHLDKCTPFKIELTMQEIAEQVVRLNYGTHRLLSALVVELRKKQQEWNEVYGDPNHYQLMPERSQLADGIEELLNKGYYK